MNRGRGRLILASSLTLLAAGCRGDVASDHSSEAVQPDLPSASANVSHSGCSRERLGSLCEVTRDSRLSLWRSASFEGTRLTLGGTAIPTSQRQEGGGYQIILEAAALRLWLDAPGDGALPVDLVLSEQGHEVFRLVLVASLDSSELREANRAKDAGEFERALQLVAQIERRGSREAASRQVRVESILARGVAARVDLRRGRVAEASVALKSTSEELYALGEVSEAGRDVLARLFILSQRASQPEAASQWLARWRERLSVTPLNTALVTENEGLLAYAADQPITALRRYRAAQLAYRRLGEGTHARRATNEIIKLLGEIGQTRRAWEQLERLEPPPPSDSACSQAHYHSLKAWLGSEVAQEGGPAGHAALERVLTESAAWQQRCHDPVMIGLDLVVQGLWWLNTRQLERATAVETTLRTLLDESSQEPQAILFRTWVADFRGQLALASGQLLDARKHYSGEIELASAAGNLDPNLRGHIGLAAVAHRSGAPLEAEAELRKAIERLDQAERWEAFGALVHSQFSERQRSARLLVDQLVAQGDVDSAFDVAVQSHGAALRLQERRSQEQNLSPQGRAQFSALYDQYVAGLQQLEAAASNDWRLPRDAMLVAHERRALETQKLEELLQRAVGLLPAPSRVPPALRPSEGQYWLVVGPSPVEAGKWLVLGRGKTTRAAIYSDDVLRSRHPGSATHPILTPGADELRSAREIVIFPGGEAFSVDFGRWLLDDKPLTRYRLAIAAGLGPAPAEREAVTRPLVLADPNGDLPFARVEATLAAEALGATGDRILMGKDVSVSRVISLLPETAFLHFAGHVREDQPGEAPALVLSNENPLETWELFSVRSVPRFVVLSACRAAGGTSGSVNGGYGMVQALLTLGAEVVIAPIADVGDERALVFQRSFYAALQGNVQRVREAFWHAMQGEGGQDVPPFRLFQR